jgi:hypothetical protein
VVGNLKLKYCPKKFNLLCGCHFAMDINKDGILDIVLGGNEYEFKPQFSRLDN